MIDHDRFCLDGDMEASMSKTPAKRDNALIIILVLAVVTALSMLAGFF
jgi:hypothetical protein